MKLFTLAGLAGLAALAFQPLAASPWSLHWSDEFDGDSIDLTTWSKCKRGTPDWKNTMSTDPKLYEVSNGTLKLKGIVNENTADDPAPFLTGGLTSKGKFNFQYGKVQIRARYTSAQGAWPALWMMGEEKPWPANGEIDLMEHLNFDDFVHQTLHSPYSLDKTNKEKPKNTVTTKVNTDAWNTYGCEWDAEKITFTVNGKPTLSYARDPEKGVGQYPFDQPFYFILSMQIGGSWVNNTKPTDPADYPSHLEIDWIRVYKLAH